MCICTGVCTAGRVIGLVFMCVCFVFEDCFCVFVSYQGMVSLTMCAVDSCSLTMEPELLQFTVNVALYQFL